MMKFKSRSARTKFKFKNKTAMRVKFRTCGAYKKSCAPKHICLAHTATTSSDGSTRRIVNLNYKELDEAKFKIPPPKRKRIKSPRSAPLGRFEAPLAYQACFFALRNRPK